VAWTTQAIASGRRMYMGQPGTTATTLYTAPTADSNVTSPSATAIVEEIILTNTTATAATITIGINGTAAADLIIAATSIAANDVKILTGMRTNLSSGDTLQGLQGTSGAITVTISGSEVA
jgi:hypothetical protein